MYDRIKISEHLQQIFTPQPQASMGFAMPPSGAAISDASRSPYPIRKLLCSAICLLLFCYFLAARFCILANCVATDTGQLVYLSL